MLQHIALEITKNDLSDFYVTILGGKIVNHFILEAEDAWQIFAVKRAVEVHYVEIEEMVYELFIYPQSGRETFNHHCLKMENASGIFKQAQQNNYWTHLRTSKGKETYFIKDKNGNMFELKNNIK